MKNFAKLKEFEFYLILQEEPTGRCKQKNDINIFSDRRVEADLGRITPAGDWCSSLAKRHMICDSGEERRDSNSVNTSDTY